VSLLALPFVPFTLALALLLAFLVLELLALLLGGSLLGAGDSDFEIDPAYEALAGSFDLETGAAPDLDAMASASEAMQEMSASPAGVPAGGLSGLLGLGHTTFMIWFASLLLGFGLGGFILQSAATALSGAALPVVLAAGAALFAGLAFARAFARRFARLLPQVETTATSAQFMGGLRGVVSQGIARAGSPAEVRLRDRHGNIHYVRCEPFLAEEVIAEGTSVLTVRRRLGPGSWGLCILALD
jgi:hypothetical protein